MQKFPNSLIYKKKKKICEQSQSELFTQLFQVPVRAPLM